MSVIFLLLAGSATAQVQEVKRFEQMKYGLFVHYVWGGTAYPATVNPDGSMPAGLNVLADRFAAEKFADDLATMNVEYVIFTAWHANMNCLWPSPKMQQWLPGHASRRDVLRDLITALKAKNIRLLLYTHPSDGHDLTPAEQAATGWGPVFDYPKWNDFINDIYGDLLARYGHDIEGVYLDEHGGKNSRFVDYPRLRQTIKSANTNLLMLQNDYGNIYNCDLGDQELFSLPCTDSDLWPALSIPSAVLFSENWWASLPTNRFAARFSPEAMFRYTVIKAATQNSAGGATWAAGVYPGGGWEPGVLPVLRGLGNYLRPVAKSITNTVASTSYITPSGATIRSLSQGVVATRSADGAHEYIHVLNPPVSGTLQLPPPADQKTFSAARLLATGKPVDLIQNTGGVTLTLSAADRWDYLDTVIELDVADKSSTAPAAVKKSGGQNPSDSAQPTNAVQANNISDRRLRPVPGMARWFDASTLTLTNGATVKLWPDLSGNLAHAATALPLENPAPKFLKDAGTGTGLGAIHFATGSGSNPAMDSQSLVFRADTNIRTVFAVFKGSSFLLTDYGATPFHRPDDTNAAAPLLSKKYASPAACGGSIYVNGSAVDGTIFLMPTNLHNGFNLVQIVTTAPVSASSFNKDRVCHAGDQYHAEVLLYDFPLTDDQRRQNEAYLKAKWFGETTSTNSSP